VRTNIDIDDGLMERALAAGPFKTKKEAVEAGLRLLERQAAYREIARWRGRLQWGWGEEERLDGQPNWRLDPAVATAEAQLAHQAAVPKKKPSRARR
jgi:antitoxin ParD1/3/4